MTPHQTQQGITLPEILVAAALLGLLIVAVSPLMTYSLRSSHINKERAAAVQAGQRIVEEIKDAGFAAAYTIIDTLDTTAPVDQEAMVPNDIYNRSLYIKGTGEVTDTPESGSKLLNVVRIYSFNAGPTPAPADDHIQVTVKITWPGSSGRNVTMGTTLTRGRND